jgi:hypothetical protein
LVCKEINEAVIDIGFIPNKQVLPVNNSGLDKWFGARQIIRGWSRMVK